MSKNRFAALCLAALAPILAISSCGIGPFQRSATLEISFSVPDDAPAPAGFIAALMDELAEQDPASRVFDPATAFIRAVITAPDIARPVVLTAEYSTGPVSIRMVAPVGEKRRLTVTALDAERSELTRGELDFEVVEGMNELTLWMKPVEELLPIGHALNLRAEPWGIDIADLSAGTSYFYVDLPLEGVFLHALDIAYVSPPSIASRASLPGRSEAPPARLYDKDGRRIAVAPADGLFPGRFSAPAGRLYIALDNPGGTEGYSLLADMDWRPRVLTMDAAGEVDSRDDIVLEFPNSLEGASLVEPMVGEESPNFYAIDGRLLSFKPPLSDASTLGPEWFYAAQYDVTQVNGSFIDPILEDPINGPIMRNLYTLDIMLKIRARLHLSPTGNDANMGRPASPMRSLEAALVTMSSHPRVQYILEAGSYAETGGLVISGSSQLLGGRRISADGAWLADPEGWSTISMQLISDTSYQGIVFSGPVGAEGISFRAEGPVSSPPPTLATVLLQNSDSLSSGVLSRCRAYSPGFSSAGTSTVTTAAISAAGSGPFLIDRCSVNWPPSTDPLSMDGVADRRGASNFGGHTQAGIVAAMGASLTLSNSIVRAGELRYDATVPPPPPTFHLNALRVATYGSGADIYLAGNSFLSGMAPADSNVQTNRWILYTDTPLVSVNNLFFNQGSVPPYNVGLPVYLFGIYQNDSLMFESSIIDRCAFSNLASADFNFAANVDEIVGMPSFIRPRLLPSFTGSNATVNASFDQWMKPVGDSTLLSMAGAELLSPSETPGEWVFNYTPTPSFLPHRGAFLYDFYGALRPLAWSVGAVEYR